MRLEGWMFCSLVLCVITAELTAQAKDSAAQVTLLAFGDVNLGRTVGQQLVKGNLDYPFRFVKDSLRNADVVFVNLESQLSDRQGETQHPKHNLIFCGPPSGARSLRDAHVTVVSTANNHAYDYGMKGLRETLQYLRAEGVLAVGTSEDSLSLFPPMILEKKGIMIGFVAYTQFVNIAGPWQGRISLFDEARARREIDSLRGSVDLVIASYHGGDEYVDRPNKMTARQLRSLVDAGADLVLGHHSHFPQGIELYRGKLIFCSLGNFIFFQPQYEWSQRGFGVEVMITKAGGRASVGQVRLVPLRAGLQPSITAEVTEQKTIIERIKKLSNVELIEANGSYFVRNNK